MQKTKVGINKVKFRLLEIWPPSVRLGFENETQISDFENLQKIGEGSFGTVHKATYKKTGAVYAIKAIEKNNKTNQQGKSYFKREIEIMYKIRHPNIVRLYTHFEDDTYCYFVMEYCSKGNLYENIEKQRKKCFDAKTVANYVKDLASAIYYLHNMDPPIIHRDIKLENVLLHADGSIKLTDFGWSNYISEDEVRDTFCGTPVYLAPEMVKRQQHDHNVDIWCLGVIMFELISGKLPFDTSSRPALEDSIIKVKITWPKDMDSKVKDLVSRILKYNPQERLQIDNIFKHAFFTNNIANCTQYLIKPSNEEVETFVISQMTPESEPKDKKAATSSKVNASSSKDMEALTKQISELKLKNQALESEKQKMEKQGKLDIEKLEKSNEKLLNEIEILNEKIELHKKFYEENLEKFDKMMREQMETNSKNFDKTAKNMRDTMNNLQGNDTAINQLKAEFEEKISNMEKTISKEREKYNQVLQNNLSELKKLQSEKDRVKNETKNYYEKLLSQYESKIKKLEADLEAKK